MMSQFKESHARLRVAVRELATQLRVLQQEKEHARKLLGTLQAQITKNKRNQFEITSRCTHLENENERAQTEAFNLVRGSIEKAREREIQQGTPTFTGELFYWPVDGGPITSSFGYRFDPVQKVNRLHRGLDIGGAFGTPIKAAADGRVIESRPSTGYGYIVVLHHGNGLSTLYAHMYGSTVTAKVGDFVHKGQVIARVGSNGWSTGPHLHFEVIEAGQAKNPITYFARKGRR
jgi:murein DD-endopeptidase MepM/ murein hydrolase activator NlpD